MKTHEYCYRCMKETDFTDGICDVCGYNKNINISSFYMAQGTELHSRYVIGEVIGSNGEGTNYVGFDKNLNRRVIIREFLPLNLCTRIKGKSIIGVSQAHLAEYKALMAEFTDLHKILAKYRDTAHINKILDLFMENNTAYVISEYSEGITLTDYLNDNAGELTWNQASKLFPPIFDTMAKLHSEGIIHRGLCPDNIYMTENGEMRIGGFSISAIRTKGAELKPEMYEGYAAPEQYSVANRQGTWTDVYALCAILYRVLTGSKPIEAMSRVEKDNLSPPYELNPNIPKYVSVTIMRGMNLLGKDRIQTVPLLSSYLFNADEEYINQFDNVQGGYSEEENPDDSYNNNNYNNYDEDEYDENPEDIDEDDDTDGDESEYVDGYRDDYSYNDDDNDEDNEEPEEFSSDKKSSFDRVKGPMIVGIVVLILLLIVVFALFRYFGGTSSNTGGTTENSTAATTTKPVSTTMGGDSEMPNLIGDTLDEAKALAEGWFTIDSSEEYNDRYAEGEIFWQEVDAGKTFSSGQTIKVKVSKGKRYIELPSYKGKTYSEYKKELDELGVPNTYKDRTDTGQPDNTVVDIGGVDDPKKYDRKKGGTVTIYYAYTPRTVIITIPDTEAQTEAASEANADTEAQSEAAPADTQAAQDQQQNGGDQAVGDNAGGDQAVQ